MLQLIYGINKLQILYIIFAFSFKRFDALEDVEGKIPSGTIYKYIYDSFYYRSEDDIDSYKSKTIRGNIDLVIVTNSTNGYLKIEGIYMKNVRDTSLYYPSIEINIYNDANGKYIKLSRIETLGKSTWIYVHIYYT